MAEHPTMILEGIATTIDEAGRVNIAPMGPHVDAAMQHLVLRPYQTAQTFANLQGRGQGVFHVTDNVELLAQAAIGQITESPAMRPATAVDGFILEEACRWYAFRVTSIDTEQPRATILAEVVDSGRQRDFFGFNRAKHAVLEAAILATRVELLPADDILAEFHRLEVWVRKTGGEAEHRAFDLLTHYVQRAISDLDAGLGRD